jgi:hypothetical protein
LATIDKGYLSLSSTSIDSYRPATPVLDLYSLLWTFANPFLVVRNTSTHHQLSLASIATSTTSIEAVHRHTTNVYYKSWILKGAVKALHLHQNSHSLHLALRLNMLPPQG